MKRRWVIGLTGGIASGKSAVLSEFRRLGARTLDCDRIAREVVLPQKSAYRKILNYFGKSIVKSNGSLHRERLAHIIFSSSAKRKALEGIVHPYVIKKLKKDISSIKSGLIVADVPLLFEAGLEKTVDQTLLVWIPFKVQISRLMKRDRLSRTEAILRIESQMPLSQKRKRSDFILDNSGTLARTKHHLQKLYKNICKRVLTKKIEDVK